MRLKRSIFEFHKEKGTWKNVDPRTFYTNKGFFSDENKEKKDVKKERSKEEEQREWKKEEKFGKVRTKLPVTRVCSKYYSLYIAPN